jgi:hypothetical protein
MYTTLNPTVAVVCSRDGCVTKQRLFVVYVAQPGRAGEAAPNKHTHNTLTQFKFCHKESKKNTKIEVQFSSLYNSSITSQNIVCCYTHRDSNLFIFFNQKEP